MKDEPPRICADCPDLAHIIGYDEDRYWCLRCGREPREIEKCIERENPHGRATN